jgi:hypothetical protein
MNRAEYMLTLLMEECAEVSQRASKCLRFGMKDTQPDHELNNTSRLLHEVIDVLTILEMMTEEGLLPEPENVDVRGLSAEKRERLATYFKLSQDLGCLDVWTSKCEHPFVRGNMVGKFVCTRCGYTP